MFFQIHQKKAFFQKKLCYLHEISFYCFELKSGHYMRVYVLLLISITLFLCISCTKRRRHVGGRPYVTSDDLGPFLTPPPSDVVLVPP